MSGKYLTTGTIWILAGQRKIRSSCCGLCLLQYIYGDSDRQVVENASLNLAYKYFLGLAVDAEVPDYTSISYFRIQRLGEEKFRSVLEQIVRQCIDKGLVKGKRQIIDSTPVIANISPEQPHRTGKKVPGKCAEDCRKAGYKDGGRLGSEGTAEGHAGQVYLRRRRSARKRSKRPAHYWTESLLS